MPDPFGRSGQMAHSTAVRSPQLLPANALVIPLAAPECRGAAADARLGLA